MQQSHYALFWIVCGVSEYPWVEQSDYAIATSNLDTILVSINKLFVEQDFPLAMEV